MSTTREVENRDSFLGGERVVVYERDNDDGTTDRSTGRGPDESAARDAAIAGLKR